jgi:hypothetical protein
VKGLFGKPENNTFSLNESKISDVPQVGEQENEILVAPFKEEVKIAIIQMEHNKAPGPDSFPLTSIRLFGNHEIRSDGTFSRYVSAKISHVQSKFWECYTPFKKM